MLLRLISLPLVATAAQDVELHPPSSGAGELRMLFVKAIALCRPGEGGYSLPAKAIS